MHHHIHPVICRRRTMNNTVHQYMFTLSTRTCKCLWTRPLTIPPDPFNPIRGSRPFSRPLLHIAVWNRKGNGVCQHLTSRNALPPSPQCKRLTFSFSQDERVVSSPGPIPVGPRLGHWPNCVSLTFAVQGPSLHTLLLRFIF